MRVETEFHKLPEVFLATYTPEIMAWAVRRDKPECVIRLLRRPGGDGGVLDISHVQQTVTLMCQQYRHPVSGETKVLVGPATDFDVEIIELHAEKLPAIKAARAQAARRWANRGEQVPAHFERIPEAFLRHYAAQFQAWGRELKLRGRKQCIPFDLAPGEARALDGENREIIEGAWFEADVDWDDPSKPRLVIRPADRFWEQRIEEHCRKMRRHWKL